MAKVGRVKEQIEKGEYDETDRAKLKAVVDGVLREFAVFADDPDGPNLVLRTATRRLDIVFGAKDKTLKLVSIDENTKADVKVLHGDECIRGLRYAVQWLDPEDDDDDV